MSEQSPPAPSTTLQELHDLRNLTREVADSLTQQNEILRTRGMKLPPGTIETLSEVIKEIASLEKNIANDTIELGQLRALAANGAMINSALDVNEVLSRAMDEMIVLVGAERGFMILHNNQSDELEFRITRDNTQKDGQKKTPQISMTIVHDVVNGGQPLLADNAYKDERIQNNLSVAQFILRSVICVPLIQRGKTIGAVYVDNRLRAGVFTQRELNLLTAFANQAAVAIENARLFERIQSALHEITEMKDVMDNVFASVGSGIITTNANDMVIIVNREAEDMIGIQEDEMIGKPLMKVLPRIEEADVDNQVRQVLEEGQATTIQVTAELPHRNTPAILNLKFSPLRDDADNTQGVTVLLDDLTEQSEREAMLEVLQNYLPPGMSNRIHEIAGIDLGGERREMTCMFVETRPFGSFPSDTTPEQLMGQINEYLSVATGAIHGEDGVIDKYMGSEVMVLFNTQLNPQPDHALRAIHTALAIRDAFLQFYAAQGITPDPHFYRIGIHSGIATLGNVGSLYRRNFTAIGDTINLSKRLEENATPGQIIVSENTLLKARATANTHDLPGIHFVERKPVQVKGRQQFTRIYEVLRES